MDAPKFSDLVRRRILFVCGKGGVGKTVISRAIAHQLPGRVLWVAFEDPLRPAYELKQMGPRLWYLNNEAGAAFDEYIRLKIGLAPLASLFLQNKMVRYLARAAPGIRELVLIGKVWFERKNYDHIVCDMPSTGYGLAMFKSMENFSNLFRGSPIQNDAEAMLETFGDPKQTGHLIVSLPEEMPLVESLELRNFMLKLFPRNAPGLIANRLMPGSESLARSEGSPDDWTSPVAESPDDYLRKRLALERHNLGIWKELGLPFERIEYAPPQDGLGEDRLLEIIVKRIRSFATEGASA